MIPAADKGRSGGGAKLSEKQFKEKGHRTARLSLRGRATNWWEGESKRENGLKEERIRERIQENMSKNMRKNRNTQV